MKEHLNDKIEKLNLTYIEENFAPNRTYFFPKRCSECSPKLTVSYARNADGTNLKIFITQITSTESSVIKQKSVTKRQQK